MARKRQIKFNILLAPAEYEKLQELAAAVDGSMGHAIRSAVNQAHAMVCLGVPTCADGQPCYVPHMHAQRRQMQAPAHAEPPAGRTG